MSSVALSDHDLRCLDGDRDVISLLEFQRIGTLARDHGFDETLAHAHRDVGHNIAEYDFSYLSSQLIPRAYRHWFSLH